ncbi:MAG: inositol monophosphatase family protein, partial [Salinimicrobium sp.]
VIYVPVTRELFWGNVSELAAFKIIVPEGKEEDILAGASHIQPHKEKGKIRIVGSRSHMNQATVNYIEKIKEEYNTEVEIVAKGSSLKFCLLAEGKADVYPRFAPTMEWDTAAGHAICRAVGLNVMDQTTGEEMKYNRKELLNNHFLVSNLV